VRQRPKAWPLILRFNELMLVDTLEALDQAVTLQPLMLILTRTGFWTAAQEARREQVRCARSAVDTRMSVAAADSVSGLLHACAVSAQAAARIDAFDEAWSAAAVTLSFVRANATHPFASSILPLIPTILFSARPERVVSSAQQFVRRCDALIGTKYGRSHVQSIRLVLASGSAPATATATATPMGL
jgi:hypothetical protein